MPVGRPKRWPRCTLMGSVLGTADQGDKGRGMWQGTSPSITGDGSSYMTNGTLEVVFQAPAAGAPVTTTIPAPAPTTQGGKPRLRVQLVVKWSYGPSHTRVDRARITRHPHDTAIQVRCRGRGCAGLHPRSGRARTLARVLSTLRGKRYRVGDRIMITLSSKRYAPEHMQITIRRGRLPAYRSY